MNYRFLIIKDNKVQGTNKVGPVLDLIESDEYLIIDTKNGTFCPDCENIEEIEEFIEEQE